MALVAYRDIGQSLIVIGPNGETITITMLHKSGRGNKLGVSAPDGWVILRNELLERARDGSIQASERPTEKLRHVPVGDV